MASTCTSSRSKQRVVGGLTFVNSTANAGLFGRCRDPNAQYLFATLV